MQITGAAGGIGSELVRAYAKQGCRVVCLDINEKSVHALVKELNSTYSKKIFGYRYKRMNL